MSVPGPNIEVEERWTYREFSKEFSLVDVCLSWSVELFVCGSAGSERTSVPHRPQISTIKGQLSPGSKSGELGP